MAAGSNLQHPFRLKLRDYQEQILANVRNAWPEFRKVLVVAPTGSGKTICFSHMAAEEVRSGGRALILVDQEELVWQAIDKLKLATGIAGEAEKAEHHASTTARVVVATVQTMWHRIYDWPEDHFSLIICDEADKSISDSWQTVLKYFDAHAKVCGFTATPNRTDKRSLGSYYQTVAAEIGLFDLIRAGHLSPIVVKMVPLAIDLAGVKITGGDFDKEQLDQALTPYLLQMVRAIKEHASFRKCMVFLPLIKTSERFVSIARSEGLLFEHIDGESGDRARILDRFTRNEIDGLANSALLLRGYDEASIDCVVMGRPTKSTTLFTQAVGRGTRIHPAKENLLLIDFLYQSGKHKLCHPANLIAKSDDEAESITKITEEAANNGRYGVELDLDQLATEAASTREENLLRKLAENTKKQAKTLSAEEFALQHHSMETAEFEPVMEWERQAMTDKQAWVLKRAKIDVSTVRGKGHASKLISLIKQNQGITLATPGQRYAMRRAGHPNWANATAAEARTFFASLRR